MAQLEQGIVIFSIQNEMNIIDWEEDFFCTPENNINS
jgi:hypothetical protein